jgi:mono/diheme cytochrome c family protein
MLVACDLPDPPQPNNTIPDTYATKHMPKGWWSNQEIIEEGRDLYLGRTKSSVNCAKCHGKIGKPGMTSARDLRNTDTMKKYSDSHLFWRISEGVPYSTMGAFKDKLSEDEIWKVIVFVSTLGMDGLQYDPGTKTWVPDG